jgi:hypothetical protein
MEHAKYLIDVVDEHDERIGQKLRGEIDKKKDIYHSAHVLLITPLGELVFSNIPEREDLPNLYANQLGITAATIVRSGETPLQAASRAISRELFIDEPELHHLDDRFCELRDGRRSFISTFYLIANPPRTYSKTDIGGFVTLSPAEFRHKLMSEPKAFAPTVQEFWRLYKDKLPI